MIGEKLTDRYLIEAELGRGGMGVVYRAADTLLKREVAIKVVSASALGTEGHGRLLQEAQAAAGLNHPHIVAVHDVGEAPMGENGEKAGYIVMELVEGRSLHGFRPESIQQLVDLGLGICAALEAAHDKGIIHRDLKPENILLTPELKVKLSDFGLARVTGATRLTREGAVMGTVSYLAPEIISGQSASVRSDLYALGVVLYELAAGRPPFQGETPMAVLSQHLHAPVVPPGTFNEELPAEIEALIVRLLAKEPGKRPASAAEVSGSLQSCSVDVPPQVLPLDRYRSQVRRLVRGRLVGREDELEAALGAWGAALAGRGGVLLVSGEPGIGKTRLVRELTTFAEVDGATALSGECYTGGDTPYVPIAQIIRRAFENGSEPDLPPLVMADLAALAPEVSAYLPEGAGTAAEIVQHRLLDSVLALCRKLADAAPLYILVEDVHWADSGTVNVLHHLARGLQDRPALLVATYRGTDLDEERPFQTLLADLNREKLAKRLKLTRLDRPGTRDLLATLFDEEITAEFLEAIYRETEGNPFFVEEISRALIDSGELFFKDGRWRRPEMDRLAIPQGVRVAIQSRLKRLSAETLSVLQTAALLGRDFRYDRLVAAGGEDEDVLITALERAEEAQIVEEVQASGQRRGRAHGPSFSFTHALIQSTLVESLSTLRRGRLQRRMALALENAFPDELEELAPMLGKFFAEAGEAEKGVYYLLAAGERARRLYAFEEAARAYEGALVFLREEDNLEMTARTLMKLGLVYQNAFEFGRSNKAYDEGLELWRELSAMPGTPPPPATRPLRVVITNEARTLDPTKAGDTGSASLIVQLFSGLVELTQLGELVPAGAVSWDVLEGGRRYVFHLRQDARWSDGRPVTAGDYEFAWKRTLAPGFEGNNYRLLLDIRNARAYHEGELADPGEVGVRPLDKWTLQVDLEKPVGYFLQLMAHASTFPVPRHTVEALGDNWSRPENLVGNGAFVIDSWTPGVGQRYVRNPHYTGPTSGNVNTVQSVVAKAEDLVSLYEADRCDILFTGAFKPEQQVALAQHHPGEHHSLPGIGAGWIFLNTTRPPLDDVRARQALALAVDKNRLIKDLAILGNAPALGGIVPPTIPGHHRDASLPFEPGRAREFLKEMGHDPGKKPFTLRAVHPESPLIRQVTSVLEKQLDEHLNIRLEVREMPLGETVGLDHHHDYHLWLYGWFADYPDPDNFLRVAPIDRCSGWHNQEFDDLVEEARVVADQAQRLAMYRRAEEILAEDVPIIPVIYPRLEFLAKPWVKNPPISAFAPMLGKDLVLA